MHQAGWVHRDVSPSNILIDQQGQVKLTDLEYAKRLDDQLTSHHIRTVHVSNSDTNIIN